MPLTPPEPQRSHLQGIAHAVLHSDDFEEALELVLANAVVDLPVTWSALVLPAAEGQRWIVEMTSADASGALGATLDSRSVLGQALAEGNPEALHAAAESEFPSPVDGETVLTPLAASQVEGGPGVLGALVVGRDDAQGPFTEASHERLDALAILAMVALRNPTEQVDQHLADERNRIARDLHDLAIQELFAVGMELETLGRAVSRGSTEAPSNTRIRTTVEESIRGVENAVAQIRQIVQSLRRERPEASLVERLHHEIAMSISGLGFTPTLRISPTPQDLENSLPDELQEDVLAVVRECLANAARHAHATAVSVSIALIAEGQDTVVQVNISDNGRGMDPSVSRRSGLANMKSRARRHNGWVDLLSLEPGTMISWRATLPPHTV